jgi:glycosyltransferase involved in cell wall biosynthesis
MVDASCFTLPYDYSLCDALGEQGCRVILACSEFRAFKWIRPASAFEVSYDFYHLTQRVRQNGVLKKVAKAAEHLLNMRQFAMKMRDLRPDVIHFQWLPVPLLDRLYLEDLSRIAPLVFTVHNTNQPRGTRFQSWYQGLGWETLFAHFKAIIVHSQYSKQRILERNWTEPEKVHIVPHGAFDYYKSLETPRNPVRSSDQVVLFFGTPEPYKGLDVLIRAFALLPFQLLSSTKLLIAGRGNSHTPSLQALSRELGIDHRVIWKVRSIGEDEVPQLFRGATVVALPYRYIDISGVLMTAVAFGKPVVANRIGGNPDVIQDGIHGKLVEPDSPEALAAALRDLLSRPDLIASMERATSHLAEAEFPWAKSAQRTLEIYHAINNSSFNYS